MRRMLIGVAVAAVMALPAAGPSAANVPSSEERASELPDLDDAMRYRESMGLPSNRAYVERAASDIEHFSTDLVGIPLTESESEEMLRRARVEYALGDVGVRYRDDPAYAGIYMDQKAGGIGYVLFTGDAEAKRAEVAAAMPFDVPFEMQSVRRSMRDLLALQAAIEKDRPSLTIEIGLVSTGVSDLDNAVVIGVEHPTDAIEAALMARYGEGLQFRPDSVSFADACTSDHNCRNPIKGGLEINPHLGDIGTTHRCTSGFVVLDTNGYYKIMTAGHCVDYWGGYDQTWYHNDDLFGHGRYDTFVNGAELPADVGLTTIQNSEIPSPNNQIYTGNGNVRNITGVRDWDGWPIDGAVQRYGTNSGWDSGTLKLRRVVRESRIELTGPDLVMLVTQANEISFDSKGGDSGGPVYALAPSGGTNRLALGVHVHSGDDSDPNSRSWYSPQDVARQLYDDITPGAPFEICSGILSICN